MKLLMILSLFMFGCEGFGVFKHEHDTEQPEGVCIRYNETGSYVEWTCYAYATGKRGVCIEYNQNGGVTWLEEYNDCDDFCDNFDMDSEAFDDVRCEIE